MPLGFVTFGSLPAGAYFHIRGKEWVKAPDTIKSDEVEYNAHVAMTNKANETEVALFFKETLVRNDPDQPLAAWA